VKEILNTAMKLELVPFAPVAAIDSVICTIEAINDPAAMNISFLINGDLNQICWPDDVQTNDALWKHTCFEYFIAAVDEAHYYEFNQAPSGAWASYRFGRYRTDMTISDNIVADKFLMSLDEKTCDVQLEVAFPHISEFLLGLAVILEDTNAQLHYFSLSHPRDKPDFHAREHYALVNVDNLLPEVL
tara:strand:- start:174 stop:734 length:561 start_codon:yes stop_codon:yes gene_type:complete